jgi:hypothetical protein
MPEQLNPSDWFEIGEIVKPSLGDILENTRRDQYNALADLAEAHGFRRDQVGVSLSTIQPLDGSTISLDMQMPPELANILIEKGFFKT